MQESKSQDFYHNLVSFNNFSDSLDLKNYYELPSDWCILITDVKGSTQLIKNGRYREVNLMGAACIASVVNTLHDRQTPYVFGGDGATFLIHQSHKEEVLKSLLNLKHYAKDSLQLDLRVGSVDMQELAHNGASIYVAKYEIASQNYLAMFRGNGITTAEKWVKNGFQEKKYEIEVLTSTNAPNLDGLSCRWQPLKNRRGLILSILIISRTNHEIYIETLAKIEQIRNISEANPALNYSFKQKKFLSTAFHESLWAPQRNRILTFIRAIFVMCLIRFKGNWTKKYFKFDIDQYAKETEYNSDYRKFDEALRLTIDINPSEAANIKSLLNQLFLEKKIFYGVYENSEALITCFVHEPKNNQHIHFIDGADGGYAMAALQLKEQMRSAAST